MSNRDPASSGVDHAVRESTASRPRLRTDLRWSCQEVKGKTVYVLEDPLTGFIFHLGERECRFARLLDGRRRVNEALARLAAQGGDGGLQEREASHLLRQLTESGLIESSGVDHAGRVREQRQTGRDSGKVLGQARSLLFLRVPLGSPDTWFSRADRVLKRVPGLVFFLVWLAGIAAGCLALAGDFPRFLEEAKGSLALKNAPLLALVWLFLKAFHECCHGLACKRFGGSVPEIGVTLLLLVTPLGYVDASSSLRFPSKWHRILVAAAGMLGEVFVAAIAAVVWARVEPGALGGALHQVVLVSSVTTLLFNANPLMRFDGYYILSDLLEIPNLYQKGQRVAGWVGRRWLLGIRGASFPLDHDDPAGFIGVYGVAAASWRVVVMAGLMAGAALLFHGAGLLLALVVGLSMLVAWFKGIRDYFGRQAAAERASPWKIAGRIAVGALVLAGILCIPVRPGFLAEGIVEPREGGDVRAECPGFVREIPVRNGQTVQAGDLLLRLENEDEAIRLSGLRMEADTSRRRMDVFLLAEELAAWQAERRHLESLKERIREQEVFLQTLDLRAPIAGVVHAPDLASLPGTFVRKGDLVVAVAGEEDKRLRLLIPQERVDVALSAVGRPFRFRAPGSGITVAAVLESVRPRATLVPPHPGLTSATGGPLVVRRARQQQGEGAGDAGGFELLKPFFPALARLDPADGRRLREGQLVRCRLRGPDARPLGLEVRRRAAKLWQRALQRRQGI